MNSCATDGVWSRRIRRMHWMGLVAILVMVSLIAMMRSYPEQTWTSLVPVLEATSYGQRYTDQDLALWISTQDTVPVRHAELKELRERIAVGTTNLERWISKPSKEPTQRTSALIAPALRTIAEQLHQQASQFDLTVKLIRIERADNIAASKVEGNDAIPAINWNPITLRLEGSYAQACRFLHHLSQENPAQCRKIRWSQLSSDSSKFELEMVLAVAIATDKMFLEISAEPMGADEV